MRSTEKGKKTLKDSDIRVEEQGKRKIIVKKDKDQTVPGDPKTDPKTANKADNDFRDGTDGKKADPK